MVARLLKNSLPWERELGLVFSERFESDSEVEANGGTLVNGATVDRGFVCSGSGNEHIVYDIPENLLAHGDSRCVTIAVECTTTLAYDALEQAVLFNATGVTVSALQKRSSDGDMRPVWTDNLSATITPATLQPLWVQNGRNLFVTSFKSGDNWNWVNGVNVTSSGPATRTAERYSQFWIGTDNAGANQWHGTILSVKFFVTDDPFTTADVERLWSLDRRNPRARADACWSLRSARWTASQSLDANREEEDLTLGDGANTDNPDKLPGQPGYSFDGSEYLTGSTTPAIVASDSITLEVLFRLDEVAGLHGLIARSLSANSTSAFLRIDDGKPEFYFRNAADANNRQWETTGDPIQFDTWYHAVFRHTYGTAASTELYLNGVLEPGAWLAGGSEQPLEDASWTWQVGDRGVASGGDQPITGDILRAAVWKEYLSPLEIKELWLTAQKSLRQQPADAYTPWLSTRSAAEALYFFGDDQISGDDTLDLSGNGYDQELFGSANLIPIKLPDQHGYRFPGRGAGYMYAPADEPDVLGVSGFTVETDFMVTDLSDIRTILNKGSSFTNMNYLLRVDTTGVFSFAFRQLDDSASPAFGSPAGAIVVGERYHMVLRHNFGDGTDTTLYINGVECSGCTWAGGDETSTAVAESSSRPLYIGTRGSTQEFRGEIYSVGIWDEYLTDAEVQTLFRTARAAEHER